MTDIYQTDPMLTETSTNPDPTSCPTCISGSPPPDEEYQVVIANG